MATSKNPLGRVGPGLWRGLCSAAGAALLATPPAMAQALNRVPVPSRDEFAWREAEICGVGGATPLVHGIHGRPQDRALLGLLMRSGSAPAGPNGCVVPRSDRGSAFRLLIDAGTGEVITKPLAPNHFLNRFEQWEKFRRSNPAGK